MFCMKQVLKCMHVNVNAAGACGFGGYGRTVNDANVAGVSRLFNNGTGCGCCYQVLNFKALNYQY